MIVYVENDFVSKMKAENDLNVKDERMKLIFFFFFFFFSKLTLQLLSKFSLINVLFLHENICCGYSLEAPLREIRKVLCG